MHSSAENIAIIFTAREELRCAGAGSPATAALLSRLSYQKTILTCPHFTVAVRAVRERSGGFFSPGKHEKK